MKWSLKSYHRDLKLLRRTMSKLKERTSSFNHISCEGQRLNTKTLMMPRTIRRRRARKEIKTINQRNSTLSKSTKLQTRSSRHSSTTSMKVVKSQKHFSKDSRQFWKVLIFPLQKLEKKPSTLVASCLQLKTEEPENMMQRNWWNIWMTNSRQKKRSLTSFN